MLNYIISDLKRIFKTKGSYYFYGVCMILFIILTFMDQSDPKAYDMAMLGMLLITASSVIVGAKIFNSVFGSDLQHKTLSLVFSTGLSKVKFVIAKMIIFIFTLIVTYTFLGMFFAIIWFLKIGAFPDFSSIEVIVLLKHTYVTLLSVLGFASIAEMLGYILQNQVVGGVSLAFMIMGLFNQIFMILASVFEWLEKPIEYLLSSQYQETDILAASNQTIPQVFFIVVLVYIIVGMIGSYIALKNRDIKIN